MSTVQISTSSAWPWEGEGGAVLFRVHGWTQRALYTEILPRTVQINCVYLIGEKFGVWDCSWDLGA